MYLQNESKPLKENNPQTNKNNFIQSYLNKETIMCLSFTSNQVFFHCESTVLSLMWGGTTGDNRIPDASDLITGFWTSGGV